MATRHHYGIGAEEFGCRAFGKKVYGKPGHEIIYPTGQCAIRSIFEELY